MPEFGILLQIMYVLLFLFSFSIFNGKSQFQLHLCWPTFTVLIQLEAHAVSYDFTSQKKSERVVEKQGNAHDHSRVKDSVK